MVSLGIAFNVLHQQSIQAISAIILTITDSVHDLESFSDLKITLIFQVFLVQKKFVCIIVY